MRSLTHVLAGSIIGGILASSGLAVASTDAPVKGRMATVINRPCATEDSTNCRWISRTGESFDVIRIGRQDCLLFHRKAYARTHDRCLSANR